MIAEHWMSWTSSCVPLEECYQWLVVELMHIYPFFLQLLLILTLLTELPRPSMHKEIHNCMNHSTEGELYCKNVSVHSWTDWVKMDWFFCCQSSASKLKPQSASFLCCRPLRHRAAMPYPAEDLHCWQFWCIFASWSKDMDNQTYPERMPTCKPPRCIRRHTPSSHVAAFQLENRQPSILFIPLLDPWQPRQFCNTMTAPLYMKMLSSDALRFHPEGKGRFWPFN